MREPKRKVTPLRANVNPQEGDNLRVAVLQCLVASRQDLEQPARTWPMRRLLAYSRGDRRGIEWIQVHALELQARSIALEGEGECWLELKSAAAKLLEAIQCLTKC